jgi:hypothetical protein
MAFSYGLQGQCPPFHVTFNSQSDVDDFVNTYPNCTEINGNLVISGADITDLTGLSMLDTILGDLSIYENPLLLQLEGLNAVRLINQRLSIFDNESLSDLNGLNALKTVRFDLGIYRNDALASLSGLDSLRSVNIGGLSIVENPVLTDLDGIRNLDYIGSEISIVNNDNLTDLTGLSNISIIENWLLISNNNLLPNLEGFENLTEIQGYMEIENNDALSDISALENITSIGLDFRIYDNDLLTNLDAFSNVTAIGGSMGIRDNIALTNIDGLSNVSSFGGAGLAIFNNDLLTNLDGLRSIDSLAGLLIFNNEILADISGVENIFLFDVTGLYIEDNPELAACSVESICIYLEDSNNTVSISNNAAGCDDLVDVQIGCISTVAGVDAATVELFPNPTNGSIQFPQLDAQRIVVFNAQGQEVAQYDNPGRQLDLSILSAGIYHLYFFAVEGQYSARVLKID